jgi:hypothetical protein
VARFNEILTGRFNRTLQKMLQIKGGPPAAQLATEIMPVFELENLPVELRTLAQMERYFGGTLLVQGATTGGAQIRNPAASNTLCVIERIMIGATVASTFAMQKILDNTDLATLLQLKRVDKRTGAPVPPIIFTSATGVGISPDQSFLVPVNVMLDLITTEHQELLLLPGERMLITNTTANATMAVNFIIRIRFLEESETT